ncbi:MAG: tRNA (adenosine(37)-N6)-threonylcarbamoyltransferase complex ATPase subunit type 1 TsaE [Planctomycetaceae bacterium]|jgi:tRNA threonylcarbamoyladenosine biosynthesis protein TsaE|nr:tRNA (adenosine(37)-N6)-threonylcarbamoyltransferase complex ATPase subunit type 1 TsaE [Planctomycetaceae bacterium]
MKELNLKVCDILGMEAIGYVLSEYLPTNSVVVLTGTLGAGKTRLVKEVAKCLGVRGSIVTSPTFVLLHEYDEGKREIYHFDVYRLSTETEFRQLDPDDYFEREGITFIEWGEKFPNMLPKERLDIQIDIIEDNDRNYNFKAYGDKFKRVMRSLKKLDQSR